MLTLDESSHVVDAEYGVGSKNTVTRVTWFSFGTLQLLMMLTLMVETVPSDTDDKVTGKYQGVVSCAVKYNKCCNNKMQLLTFILFYFIDTEHWIQVYRQSAHR